MNNIDLINDIPCCDTTDIASIIMSLVNIEELLRHSERNSVVELETYEDNKNNSYILYYNTLTSRVQVHRLRVLVHIICDRVLYRNIIHDELLIKDFEKNHTAITKVCKIFNEYIKVDKRKI